ncbi:hypothetical protein FRC05_008002 [Tulasnella sp. 425]|nr:hypothetical protein FRC05_008002 [Tulasnella sp. 425]
MSQDGILDYPALQRVLSSVLATLEPLRIPPERLDVPAVGGSYGGFGEVFQARLRENDSQDSEWQPVAVKKLRMAQGQDLRVAVRLAREMKVWADLKHPNIVPFVGFHLGEDDAWLISSWASKGDAHGHLLKSKSDFTSRVKLLLDAAEGLEYLHGRNPPVCHGDIKSANVLVAEDVRGMLGDFGLSRVLEADPTGLTTSRTIKGSMRYMSLELLNGDTVHTLQSDVWAFGCLALEILTGQHPFHKCQNFTQVIVELSLKRLPASLDEPPVSDLPPGLALLLELCWTEDPAARPAMTKCVEVVRNHLQPDISKSLEVTQAVLLPREIKTGGEGWSASFNPNVFPSFNLKFFGELLQTKEVQFFPGGERFATIRYDGLACIIDTPTGSVQAVLDPSPGESRPSATFLSLSRDGERLAVANTASIIIWDIPTATVAFRLDDTTMPDARPAIVTGMKLSGNGQVVVYVSTNAVVYVWHVATNKRRPLVGTQRDPRRYSGNWPIGMSFDGRYVSVASVDGYIGIYSSKTGELVEVLIGHKGPVSNMAWSSDGNGLLSGSWDKSAKFWDVSPLQYLEDATAVSLQMSLTDGSTSGRFSRRGSVCLTTYSAKDPVEWVFISLDESWYASCSADGDLHLWDPKSGVSELKMKLKGLRNNAEHFDLSPTFSTAGGWLAMAKDYQSSIWRYGTVEEKSSGSDAFRP